MTGISRYSSQKCWFLSLNFHPEEVSSDWSHPASQLLRIKLRNWSGCFDQAFEKFELIPTLFNLQWTSGKCPQQIWVKERKENARTCTAFYSHLNRPKRSISPSLSQKTVIKIPMDVYRISIIILKRYLDYWITSQFLLHLCNYNKLLRLKKKAKSGKFLDWNSLLLFSISLPL